MIEDYSVLQKYNILFSDEVMGPPPKRDIDFTINLVLGTTLVSKAPYRINTLELVELKMQL